jgi:hypothetical protein
VNGGTCIAAANLSRESAFTVTPRVQAVEDREQGLVRADAEREHQRDDSATRATSLAVDTTIRRVDCVMNALFP